MPIYYKNLNTQCIPVYVRTNCNNNNNQTQYNVHFQFINFEFNDTDLEIYDLNNKFLKKSFIEDNKTSFKLANHIDFFYLKINNQFCFFADKEQTDIYINERSILANIICLVNYHTNLLNSNINEIYHITTGLSLIKSLYENEKEYNPNTNYAISDVINFSPNGANTSSRNLFNFYVNCYYLYHNEPNFKTFFDNLIPQIEIKSFYYIFLNLYKYQNNNYTILNSIIQEVTNYSNLPVVEYTVYDSTTYDESTNNTLVVNNFIIALKFNNSGSINNLIGGPANYKIDKNGRIWITNNVIQGTGYSSNYIIVLEKDGTPASFSPLFDKNLKGTGYGVEMSKPNLNGDQYVFSSSYGWGSDIPLEPFEGNIVKINVDTLEREYSNITTRVQGMKIDNDNNLWICSYGDYIPMGGKIPEDPNTYLYQKNNSTVGQIFCVLNLDFNNYVSYNVDLDTFGQSFKYHPFCVDANSSNEIFVSCSGDYNNTFGTDNIPGSVLKLKLQNNAIELLNYYFVDNLSQKNVYKGCCVNESGDKLYVCDIQNDRVIEFNTFNLSVNKYIEINKMNVSNDGYIARVDGPWGVAINKDELIISNFGKNSYVSGGTPIFNPTVEYVNMLVIYNINTETYKGYILTTAGDSINLKTEQNFYNPWGTGDILSYQPIQRSTYSGVDKIGNIILMNNWKPLIFYDTKTVNNGSAIGDVIEESNPGGDSVVMFLGITDFSI